MRIMRIRCASKCNCYTVLSLITRNGETYRCRQLFSSTCHIHTRIRNEICMRWEKKISRKSSSFWKDAVSILIQNRHLWHTQPSQLRDNARGLSHGIYTYNNLLGAVFRTQYNAYMRIYYVNANVQLHADITSISHGGSDSVRKANRAYHFPAGKCRLHSSAHR